ncbi:MAG: isocitrate dehydrogenase [Phycisphaerae bacterium]|jgi:isocitrate dehydrogenase|nr:MAG: isocitrate dehydrogenase [Phycisphaerae bacterium]
MNLMNISKRIMRGGIEPVPVVVAAGDGIGPEIMEATLSILEAAGASLDLVPIEIGESVYKQGYSSGISPESWEHIRERKVILKGPITTPQGGGVKSLNVTLRKTLGLYANVRPCIAYDPYIPVRHPHLDVVIIRENEEDLYAGIEHRQTDQVFQCLKLITRPGCERIVRFAFEYALRRKRKKVTCFVKDNIMKLTDGLFKKVFYEISAEYPDLKADSMIVDIGMARLANAPELFDVIVLPNLYGDILSDIAAELSGSVGLAPSANIGENYAMFEAIHGSAPDIAGQNIANPSGLLLSAVKMLAYIGQGQVAERIHSAWMVTIEDGIHTADMYRSGTSQHKAGTQEFAKAVIERLGQNPSHLRRVTYAGDAMPRISPSRLPKASKNLIGIDVFIHDADSTPDELADLLKRSQTDRLQLVMITNRGVKVWPDGFPETFTTDHWRCRFQAGSDDQTVTHAEIIELLNALHHHNIDFIKTEHLYTFDGVPGFSLGQGQ